MVSELLQQVRVLDPIAETDRVADVWLVDGVVQAVGDRLTELPSDTQIQPAVGWVLGPGLVDLYSHTGEPGFESRETLASLMAAAAVGGFTRLAVLPQADPPTDTPAAIAHLQDRWATLPRSEPHRAKPQLLCWAALTQQRQGEALTELADLATAGAVGFTDGRPLPVGSLLRRALEYLQPRPQAIALWPVNRALQGDGVMREGHQSTQLGLPGVPVMAESAALAAILECVARTERPVHLMRLSTARSVELIASAKQRGLPVTASTTWLHLLGHSGDLAAYDPHWRLDPPLGNPDDQAALREAVRTGVLDAIAIDHTPYTYEEKTVPFAAAPPGAIGLELALPLLWQQLVTLGDWSPLELWRGLSTAPAHCLGQPPPTLTVGAPAELTLFDPTAKWIVTRENLRSRSQNTPWLGQTLTGRVLRTWR